MVSMTISVPMRATRFATTPEGIASVRCLNCDSPLELHQPDPELPERLLASCGQCDGWHVISLTADQTEAVIVLLPDCDTLRHTVTAAEAGRKPPRRGPS
jgi:hypothetical protein